jgi:serine/threonine protein kinase
MGCIRPDTVIGEYRFLSVITEAESSSIWLAEHTRLCLRVTIQVIERSFLQEHDRGANLTKDIAILKQIEHPFIAKFFEMLEDYDSLYLVFEYPGDTGPLSAVIEDRGPVPEIHGRRFFSQLIYIIDHLKCLSERPNFKFTSDAVLLDRHGSIRLHYSYGISGSLLYSAPEILAGEPESEESNIWSIGVILCQIVTGTLPFADTHSISATPPSILDTLSPQLSDLLNRILQKTDTDRISLEKIKEHPWFSAAEYATWRELSDVDSVSRDVTDRLMELGYDTRTLPTAILGGGVSPLIAPYELIKRDQLTERIDEVVQRATEVGSPATRAASQAASQALRSVRRPPPKAVNARKDVLTEGKGTAWAKKRGSTEGTQADPRLQRTGGRLPVLMRPRTNSVVHSPSPPKPFP